jgi:hypothetical protein
LDFENALILKYGKKNRKLFIIRDEKSSVYILLTNEKFMNFYKIHSLVTIICKFDYFFWYIEKLMYLVHNMDQINHFFNVPRKSNLLIIVAEENI